jgi:hypothetical protein
LNDEIIKRIGYYVGVKQLETTIFYNGFQHNILAYQGNANNGTYGFNVKP